MLNKKLLEILVCPKCRKSLNYDKKLARLTCEAEQLFYPIHDDIPVLLSEDAQSLL
jgi:uncharacterized protein YbaR (Trm112 family)